MSTEWITLQPVPRYAVMAFEPLPHVGCTGCEIDAYSWAESKHSLHGLQQGQKARESPCVEPGLYLDLSTTCQNHDNSRTLVIGVIVICASLSPVLAGRRSLLDERRAGAAGQ